jgi:WD40 repeat protein
MAPEQAEGRDRRGAGGRRVRPRGILYDLLTGRPPFAGTSAARHLTQVRTRDPVPPRPWPRPSPATSNSICLKCLAEEPGPPVRVGRGELADDLDRFGAGVPVTARPVPPLVRLARCVARNPAPAALAAVVVAVVAAAPAAWFWHSWRTDSLEARALRDAIARGAAERRAADRELVALQATIGQRATERRPGWTWANRAELARAAALAADNPAALAALRAEAAAALFAPDLRKADPIAAGFSAGTAARSADGTRVALGMQNVTGGGVLGSWASLKVLVVDPDTGAKYADVSFPAGTVVRDGRRAPDRVVSLAYGPDGRWLFAGTRSARVVRIDTTADPPAVKVWNAPAQPDPLVVSADGAAVVGCCGTKIVRWDARTGAKTGEFEGPPGGGLAALPDGGLVAAFPEGLARAGGRGGKLDFPPPKAAGGYVRHPVAFPGGKLIAAARGGTIELWDADALATVGKFTDPDLLNRAAHAADVTGLAVHPSGAYLASAAADRSVKVWAVGSGLRVGGFQLPGTGPAALAWSAGGRFLLATGVGDTARFEFAAPAAERYAAPHPHPVAAAAVDPAGGVVALAEFEPGANARTLFRTDPAGLPAGALAVPDAARPALAVHPADGRVVATREAGLQWWHPDGSTAGPRFSDLPCRCPAFSADGGTLWAIADSKTVRAWDAATGAPRGGPWVNDAGETVLGQGSLEALAVGKVLAAAGGRDGAVRLFGPDVAMLKDFQSGNDPVAAVAVAPDDEFVAAGAQSGKLRLVRVADRTELAGVPDAHAGGVTAVSFAAGGTLLASGGNDRAVRFWRVGADGSAEPLAAVTGLPAPVRGVSFARSGERLVVQLLGGRAVRVWDVGVLRAQLSGLGLGW